MRRATLHNPRLNKRFGTYQQESHRFSVRQTPDQRETSLRRSRDLLLTTKRVTSSNIAPPLNSAISSGIDSIFTTLKTPDSPNFLPTVNYLCDTFKHGLLQLSLCF